MKVVCISGKAGSGKDTFAGYMAELGKSAGKSVAVIHYADLLKYICREYFDWDGKKDENGRTLLQNVGTEFVRKKEPDFWVGFVESLMYFFPEKWDYVIIPDARFPNEIEYLRANGHVVTHIHIDRPEPDARLTSEQAAHPSETALDGYPADITVTNNEDLLKLRRCAKEVAEHIGMTGTAAPSGVTYHKKTERALTTPLFVGDLFGFRW